MYFIKIIVPLSNYLLSFTDNVLTFIVNERLIEKKSEEYKNASILENKTGKKELL